VRPEATVRMEDGGYHAVIADGERNRIGLHSMG
jgi:predicted enzyme related to lactoylglutathione lyase